MHITINGQQYHATSAHTILDVATANQINIPTLCHSPFLSTSGACRMCLVEIEGEDSLAAACVTPVQDRMRVQTNSPRVIAARRDMLDLILSEHYLDCITCEATGECKLQDLAYEYDISESSFGQNTEPRREQLDENAFIEYIRDKCILCGLCIRIDHEIQNSYAIDFAERGFETTVAAPFGLDFGSEQSDCVFCGQCVDICPTGALRYRPAIRGGRDYMLRPVTTICPYCGVGCQLTLKITDNNQIIRVSGAHVPASPNPAGQMCVKGRFGHEFVSDQDRLTSPLIRKDGVLQKASWEEALDLVAHKLTETIENYGPDAVAGLSSAKCTNEENFLMQKFMRAVIGTNNIDHCARLCHASTVAGLGSAFGSGAMTNSIDEIEESDVLFVIGSNPTENHPVIGSMMKRAIYQGTKLIVADPRNIELAYFADVHLQQRPGTDVALINGLLHTIIREHLHDEAFIKERTDNFEAVKEIVSEYTPEKVAEITGISPEQIEEAARLYGSASRAAIYFAMGITQHHTGTDNVLALANLAMLTGNIGRRGTGVNPLRGQNNVQGACDMGALPNVFPGYQSVTDEALRETFSKAWGRQVPAEPGLTVVEILKAAGKEIRTLYVIGENLVLSDPDQNAVVKSLDSLDFLIVQDLFLTETAEFADVVLPAASFAEKGGTFTNTERRIQRLHPALPSPGEARTDSEILVELSERMGFNLGSANPEIILQEVAALTPIYGGITPERLHLGLQWPCTDADHLGTPRLHTETFTRGKGRFHPTVYLPPAEQRDDEFPFILMTGRMLYHYHTGTMTRRSSSINEHEPKSYIEINEDDARFLGITTDDRVKVRSRRGEITTWARVGETVSPGQVFMPFHYSESPANRLTGTTLDPVAKIPELKVSAVAIEPLQG